ncbi:MAG: homoserine O-acetyltransferase [Rhizobacter sp.]|nr:homoserine O-acetyltransferase [Rhizobacter sp.]
MTTSRPRSFLMANPAVMAAAASEPDHAVFDAGSVVLQSGRTFRGMKLAYKTYGQLNADRSNVILYPTSYSAQHRDIDFMVSEGGALDPSKYFIVIVNLFGNGLSSSPSNTPWPDVGSRYPLVTVFDAVQVQRRMLREVFGIERLKLVYGWSMGAMQAYPWAALFPEAVERIAVVCGAARCAPHNHVFIDGAASALMADPAYRDGLFEELPIRGLRAMGRVYAGWALSQTFYRQELWRMLGATSLEDFLVSAWETTFARRDPLDLLAQFRTWQHGDIAANDLYGGDLSKALAAIEAKVLLMPGDHDLYFQVDDNRLELEHLRHGTLSPIPSVWGHRAGNPGAAQPEDRAFIETQVKALLAG